MCNSQKSQKYLTSKIWSYMAHVTQRQCNRSSRSRLSKCWNKPCFKTKITKNFTCYLFNSGDNLVVAKSAENWVPLYSLSYEELKYFWVVFFINQILISYEIFLQVVKNIYFWNLVHFTANFVHQYSCFVLSTVTYVSTL